MVKEENKFGYGIKGKLISAIAMLLVAVIMVVSSTYAWFTLSTAPEVTGITTAVGANGALEMLLLTLDADGKPVYKSGSVQAGDDVNTYWGNLVKLSEGYGADKIVLYPSELNLEGDLLGTTPLKTPVYKEDGRVYDTTPNTVYGVYNSATGVFDQSDDYGFRGVGVASGMTERQLAYRNARSQISSLMAQARNAASDSLTNNGSVLADIAMKRALATNPTYTVEEIEAIGDMISDLKVSLGYVEQAYIQAYLAFAASSVTSPDPDAADPDAAYNVLKGIIEANDDINALDTAIKAKLTEVGLSEDMIPSEITTGIVAYNKALDDVEDAEAKYNDMAKTDTTDFDNVISPALTPLVNMSSIQINGVPANEAGARQNEIISSAFDTGILVTMATNGGVYADIADQAGDYRVDITIKLDALGSQYAGMDMGAKMETKTTVSTVYLTAVYNKVSGKEPTSGNASMPLTEFYGYVIDLAFKTNAAQSNLLLQQQGVDRIYGDNNNEATMGAGSTMNFTSVDNNFSAAQVKELMRNIRIVFFNPDTRTIYAYAKLDVDNAVTDADGTTAYMYLYKTVENAYKTADNTIIYEKEGSYYSDEACTALYTGDTSSLTAVSEVKLSGKDAIITDLTQNEASHVSTLVYLDGKTIENGDVAASVAKSMTGKMNLQFASDATLVPMEYGELHTTGTATEEATVAQDATYTPTAINNATWAFKGTSTWTINATTGMVTPSADAEVGDEVVITATVDNKVVKEITIKVVAAAAGE